MAKPGAAIRAAGWVTVGVIAAGGVATAATVSSNSPKAAGTTAATSTGTTSTGSSPSAAKRAGKGALGKLKGRLLHGQFTVLGKDGKPTVLAEQRGTVESVSSTSIQLKSKDGFEQTYVVTPTTKVRVDGKKGTISDVKTGQAAGVIASVSGTTETAKGIVERAAAAH